MNDPQSTRPLGDVNAYLDGLMNRTEREQFARRLKNDASLRAEVVLQERIGRQLQAHFHPPAPPPVDLPARSPADSVRQNGKAQTLRQSANRRGPDATPSWLGALPGRHTSRWLFAGLTVVLSVAAIGLLWHWLASASSRAVSRERPLAEVMQETIDLGFQPEYVGDEERMRTSFYVRHGQALRAGELPGDRQVLGLSFLPSLSRHTTAILARSAGQPVMVFVDKLSRDRPLQAPSSRSGLHVFRRELGDLVMYEVSSFDEAQILWFLLAAEPPPDACLVE